MSDDWTTPLAVVALSRSMTLTGEATRAGSLALQGAISDLALDEVRPLPLPANHQPNDDTKELATT